MTRHMRKLTYSELEEHVRFWWEEQVLQNQEMIYEIMSDDTMSDYQKLLMKAGVANNLIPLQELILPFKLDDEELYEWSASFIKKHEDISEEAEKN